MGHPLGASGGRILGTLAGRLAESGERWGVAAICIGVGQGLAVVLENSRGDPMIGASARPTTRPSTASLTARPSWSAVSGWPGCRSS